MTKLIAINQHVRKIYPTDRGTTPLSVSTDSQLYELIPPFKRAETSATTKGFITPAQPVPDVLNGNLPSTPAVKKGGKPDGHRNI
jgi:hypothetical protein